MTFQKIRTLALITILMAAFGYTASRQFRTKTPAPVTRSSDDSQETLAGVSVHRSFEPGRQVRYHLTLAQQGIFETSKLLGGQGKNSALDQTVQNNLAGEWVETVLAYDAGHTTSLISFEHMETTLRINNSTSDALNTNLLESLTEGVYIERDRDLRITVVKVPNQAQPVVKDIIYSLVRDLQVVIPEGPLTASWKSVEDDLDGQFEARYSVQGDPKDGIVALRKSKDRYTKLSFEIDNGSDHPSTSLIANTDLSISYSAGLDQVVELKGTDTRDYYTDNQLKLGSSTRKLTFSLIQAQQIDASALTQLKTLANNRFNSIKDYDSYASESLKQQITIMHQKELGTDDLSNLLELSDRLKTLQGQAFSDARLSLYLKLKALIYLFPDRIDQLKQAMIQQGVESLFFSVSASSMVAISSPECQKSLVELAQQYQSNIPALQTLLPSLGFVKRPLPIIEDALRDFEQSPDHDIKSNAGLAMGVHIGQLKLNARDKDAKQRFENLEQEKLSALKGATTDEDISQQLSAIGNFGSETGLLTIATYLGSPSAMVRSAATAALRFIDTDRSMSLVFQRLLEDTDEGVRFEAADALGYFKPTLPKMNQEISQFHQEKASRIRIQLLQNIAKEHHLNNSQYLELVSSLAKSEQDLDVRHFAEGLLIEIQHSFAQQ